MTTRFFSRSVRPVLIAQFALTFVLITVTLAVTTTFGEFATGISRAKACAFGAALGMLATLVTARSVLQSGAAAENPARANLAIVPVFSGLLVKLLVVAGGAFAGLIWLQLPPFFLLLGYITMQAGYFWAGRGK